MTRTVTKKAVKRVITKGLTGWEVGKLVLQDFIDSYHNRDSVLTEADMETIQSIPMKGDDVKDYNTFMALCRGFYKGCILGELACTGACLQISFLDHLLCDANRRRTVELFESCSPRVITRKQYEDIMAAQREKKLKFEYSLDYVIEKRFYAIAPPEVEKEIEDAGVDIESMADFVAAVPEAYSNLCKQAFDEILCLYTEDKLPAVCHKNDIKKAEPLLVKWKKEQLSEQDTINLMDMLYITGKQLYDCDELPEWKEYMDKYDQYLFGNDDKRFQHVYAVLEDYAGVWVDEQDCYKGPPKPSKYITRSSELLLGLINNDNKPKKSIKSVGIELRDRLDTAEQNIRFFLAIKAILDAAAETVGLDIPGKVSVLIFPYIRISAFIELYNLRLEELMEERKPWESGETRLEKALKMLPAIDPEKLRPSPDSMKQLKDDILKDTKGEEWLRTWLLSIECRDGFHFKELLNN